MVQTPTSPVLASLPPDAVTAALELCGVMAAHRAAYDPVRAELLEAARLALEDALGVAVVSRRPPMRRYGVGRR
jgi:hypothetical protein